MMWKALLVTLIAAFVALTSAAPQYLGLGGVVGKNITPRGGSVFPAYARNPYWAAFSGRGYYSRNMPVAAPSSNARIDYGVRSGNGYRPARYLPFSTKG